MYKWIHCVSYGLTCLPIECLCELVDWRRNLQSLQEDCPLSLQTNILRPAYKPTQITLGLDVLTCQKESVFV